MNSRISRILVALFSLLFLWMFGAQHGVGSIAAQATDKRVILPSAGQVEIAVANAVTNTCDGDLLLVEPEERVLFTTFNDDRGQSVIVGPYAQGEEIVLALRPHGGCSGYTYPNTHETHTRVHAISTGIWRIEWEDLPANFPPDWDYDDLIVTVRVSGAYPDFKQNDDRWSSHIYDGNTDPYYSIGSFGCAMTAIANLLAYYGARDVDPDKLNDWLNSVPNGFDVKGGVYWQTAALFRPTNSDVPVMEHNGRLPITNRVNFDSAVASYLAKNWPVILRLDVPDSPTRIHFVVAVGKVVEGGKELYVIKDPLKSSGNYKEITRLEVSSSAILSAELYSPSDGASRPNLMVYGLSPIALLMTNGQGQRVGFDPESGETISEIAGAQAYYDLPYWVPDPKTNDRSVGERSVVEIPYPASGAYRLEVFGTGTGPYTIETTFDDGVSYVVNSTASGNATIGKSEVYDLYLTSSGVLEIESFGTLSLETASTTVGTGAQVQLTARYTDYAGSPIADLESSFTAERGSVSGDVRTDPAGVARAVFTAPATPGDVRVTVATLYGSAYVNIRVVQGAGAKIHLPAVVYQRAASTPVPTPIPTLPPPAPNWCVNGNETPIDLLVAIDHSSSFAEQGRMNLAQTGVGQILYSLDMHFEQVGIVAFDEHAHLVQTLTTDIDALNRALWSLEEGDGTAIGTALQVAAGELVGSRHKAANRAVLLLLTDGENLDGPDPVAIASEVRGKGIRILAVSAGETVFSDVLAAIAPGGSDYIYSTDLQQIPGMIRTVIDKVRCGG